jgi:hypothetical protein
MNKHLAQNVFAGLGLATILMISARPAAAAPIRIQAAVAPSGSSVLELQTDELVTMTPVPFRLLIKDANGQPLTGAQVTCDMTMPSMTMPENRPKVTEQNGIYTGEMIFTCAMGAWRVACTAVSGEGSSRTMIFDIESVKMK